MPTVADYEDAVRRIARADVPDDATTSDEVSRALRAADAPQITDEVADGVAKALVTEERVIEAIEETGEVPTEGEIDALSAVADDYGLEDRVEQVAREVAEQVATIEDIETAVMERVESSAEQPTFREDVESAVNQLARDKQLVGASVDEVAGEQAREVGAPRQADFDRAATQTVAQAEQTTPSEVIGEDVTEREGVGEGTAQTPISVIRDDSGDAVAVTGGVSRDLGDDIGDQLGADFMEASEVREEMDTEGVGETVALTLKGDKVGEVDVE